MSETAATVLDVACPKCDAATGEPCRTVLGHVRDGLFHQSREDALIPVELRDLTPRQRAIVVFIRDYMAEHGWSPSHREIGAAVGLSSTASVHHQLRRLADLGVLRLGGGQRCVAVVADVRRVGSNECSDPDSVTIGPQNEAGRDDSSVLAHEGPGPRPPMRPGAVTMDRTVAATRDSSGEAR